jgi:hypothetical protein
MLFELRHAWRRLRRSPVFTAVAVASLALGIGANSAIFNLIHAAILDTVPVRDVDHLYWLRVNYPGQPSARWFSYPFYKQLLKDGTGFEDLLCSYPIPLSLSTANMAERVAGDLVSGNYFQMLGVDAHIGRLITPADDHPVAVLSFEFWKRRFGGDAGIVGKDVRLNDRDRSCTARI